MVRDAGNVDVDARAGEAARGDLAQRLAFLGLTEADAKSLRALLPIFRSYADQFVEEFYRHLFQFDETARFLHDAALVQRLKRAQREHFETMLEACWDERYVAQRRRVGDAHAETGIEPDVFLGAYNQYVQHCLPVFAAAVTAPADGGASHADGGASHADAAARLVGVVLPLVKAMFLDIGLTLDAYFQQATHSLRLALDLVWKANNELRQFAQLTSHDLKTPLATVANLCDEALDEFGGRMPSEARKLIEAARNRTFRMSRTIDELLESSLTAARGDSDDDVSCQDFIDEAVERVRPMLDKKGIEVVVARPLPTVWGNRVRLREAFYNLIANAAKFIDKTPGLIEIAATATASECVLSVSDNGPGIAAEELDRVFVPFRRLRTQRGDGGRGTGQGGSGLGLYFTKTIVEEHGGRIWVESTLGHGSQFHVALSRTAPDRNRRGGA